MNYTLSDLIEKLIDIEKDFLNIYIKIEEQSRNRLPSVCAVTKAIEIQEKKHIEYYEKLKSTITDELDETIEFYLYDKVAKLLFEFRRYIKFPEINNVQDLLKYTVEFEKNNIGLLIDIQGRLLEKKEDVNNNIYKVLSEIIKEEERHEKMFEKLLI